MATVAVVEKYIDISPEIRFGKPCISGTRIAVVDIANWHNKLGMPLEQIAGDYDLPLTDFKEIKGQDVCLKQEFQTNSWYTQICPICTNLIATRTITTIDYCH